MMFWKIGFPLLFIIIIFTFLIEIQNAVTNLVTTHNL